MFEKKVFIQNGEENKRLDKFIALKLNISRNKVQQLIQNNKIYLFDKVVKIIIILQNK